MRCRFLIGNPGGGPRSKYLTKTQIKFYKNNILNYYLQGNSVAVSIQCGKVGFCKRYDQKTQHISIQKWRQTPRAHVAANTRQRRLFIARRLRLRRLCRKVIIKWNKISNIDFFLNQFLLQNQKDKHLLWI